MLSDLCHIVLVLILYSVVSTSARGMRLAVGLYTHSHTDYLSWSRNAAICAGIVATVRIYDTRGVDPLPSVGSESLITGVCVCVRVGGCCISRPHQLMGLLLH